MRIAKGKWFVTLTSVTTMAPHCSATLRRLSPTFADTVTCTQKTSLMASVQKHCKICSVFMCSIAEKCMFEDPNIALVQVPLPTWEKNKTICAMYHSYQLTSLLFSQACYMDASVKSPSTLQKQTRGSHSRWSWKEFTHGVGSRCKLHWYLLPKISSGHTQNLRNLTNRIHRTRPDYATYANNDVRFASPNCVTYPTKSLPLGDTIHELPSVYKRLIDNQHIPSIPFSTTWSERNEVML